MRLPVLFVLCLIASVGAYGGMFAFVIKKPMTIGFIDTAYTVKEEHARAARGRKLLIQGGSNVLFSHRCETMEPILGITCVNSGVTAGLGTEFALEKARDILAPGDVVYMPLEFEAYLYPDMPNGTKVENEYALAYEPRRFWQFPPERIATALFSNGLADLISGVIEMGLDRAGVQRRFNRGTLTTQGDLRGHTVERGRAYQAWVKSAQMNVPDVGRVDRAISEIHSVVRFLDWAHASGVTVIGGLPTTYENLPLTEAQIDRLANIYSSQGAEFLVLDNKSQYARSCFYDNPYHLNEICQISHSQHLAEALKPMISRIPSRR